jgi:hypothetical protein
MCGQRSLPSSSELTMEGFISITEYYITTFQSYRAHFALTGIRRKIGLKNITKYLTKNIV